MSAPTIIREQLVEGVTLWPGDCRAVLPTLAPNSFDSCVTDPPYHLTSIVQRFGGENAAPAKAGKTGAYARASAGFMGKQWDGGDVAFQADTWREVYRVLKPGAHLLAFGGTRTFHRMACAIEDAGFEIRDAVMWVYGSGFPKSHDVSKGIDRAAGAKREVVGVREYAGGHIQRSSDDKLAPPIGTFVRSQDDRLLTAPATSAAREWEGWGTALKPAHEPILLCRKPLSESTIAANVLRWGCGALNIGACRVATGDTEPNARTHKQGDNSPGYEGGFGRADRAWNGLQGRWPANLLHDGSDEVMAAFPDAPGQQRSVGPANGAKPSINVFGDYGPREQFDPRADSGSAARFFYTAKADADDRLGSKHPTVKPLDLMQYLVRLVTPKGGTVLDPFAGTGTTGEAAFREGMKAVLIEREPEYVADIRRRMALVMSGSGERKREGVKARHADKPADHGPLFGAPG